MELMMFVGNDCIDMMPVDHSLIASPGYVSRFVRLLKDKHQQLLHSVNGEVEFLLHEGSVRPPEQNIQPAESVAQIKSEKRIRIIDSFLVEKKNVTVKK